METQLLDSFGVLTLLRKHSADHLDYRGMDAEAGGFTDEDGSDLRLALSVLVSSCHYVHALLELMEPEIVLNGHSGC